MPVTPSQTQQYARALGLTKPQSRRRLYCVTRGIFVTGFQQVPAFDKVFGQVFGGRKKAINPDDFDVELELPWPIPDVGATVTLEWDGPPEPPDFPNVIQSISLEHQLTGGSWKSDGTSIPDNEPVAIPLETMFHMA